MKYLRINILALLALVLSNCSEDEPELPLADFQFLVEGTKVTFNGTVANTTAINWDFGNGATSTEEDPVYIYDAIGTYTVVMTATGENGSFSETKEVTILPSLEILLTGGEGRPEGKTWRLKNVVVPGDGAGNIENDLSLFINSLDNLLAQVGLGSAYSDTFTFVHDGTYKVDNNDGQSLMGLLYANVFEQQNIRAVSGDIGNVPLADVAYSPASDATWAFDTEDFTVESAGGPVQFTDKRRLVLTEYLGFKDASNIVILKDINETTMSVAIAIHTVQQAFDKPSLFFHLSFESP